MTRPVDWYVLDLDEDPTPGDPYRVRELARAFLSLSADAFAAAAEVRRLAGEERVVGWEGEAGAVFAGAIGELPAQLDRLDSSYGIAGRALQIFAGELEAAQTQADSALARGRDARARLTSAQTQVPDTVAAVDPAWVSAGAASGLAPLSAVPASWSSLPPPLPDAADVRAATRAHESAVAHVGYVNGYVNGLAADAQDDVDAERRLALAAKGLREQAAQECRAELDRARDAGIQNRSFWGFVSDVAEEAWDRTVEVAKVVVVVAGIAAFVVGGPLAWVALAAALIVLADTLHRYADGEATLWDVGLALVQCVPGTRGITTVAGLARGARAAATGLRGGVPGAAALGYSVTSAGAARLAEMATSVRSGVGAITTVRRPALMGGRHHELEGIVDIGFTRHSTRIGSDRRTLAVTNRVRPLDGYHDVVIHGSPNDFIPLGPGHLVNPAHVAETILANPHYVPGTPVRALSCWSGTNGVDGPAQQLADYLQADVVAPTVLVGVPGGLGKSDPILGVGDDVVVPGSTVSLESGEEVVAEWVRLTPRIHPAVRQ